MQEFIGYAAATLTTSCFVPQLVKLLRTRDTTGISLFMYVVFSIGICLWLLYGILLGSWPIIFSNTATLTLSIAIIMAKRRIEREQKFSNDAVLNQEGLNP